MKELIWPNESLVTYQHYIIRPSNKTTLKQQTTPTTKSEVHKLLISSLSTATLSNTDTTSLIPEIEGFKTELTEVCENRYQN